MYEYSSGPLSIGTPRARSQSARSSTSNRDGASKATWCTPIRYRFERPSRLGLRLPESERAAGAGDVPDRLAALALDLADPLPAERLEELSVERQAPENRADDEVDVVEAGGAHVLPA